MAMRWLFVLILSLNAAACSKFSLRSQSPDKDEEEHTKAIFIGDQVTIAGLHPIQIEGVGLITGLDGTGEDPAPSLYRTLLVEEMQKRGIKQPNRLLQSPNTALVLVRAALPPVAQIGDRFDIEVVLPENSQATSLAGGWLLQCSLAEQAIVPGRGAVAGHTLAKSEGPILVSFAGSDETSKASGLKRGKILGGAVYTGGLEKKERKLGLYLRNEFRNVRNAKRISDRIGQRFHYFEHGLKKPLAKATTDQHIELKVHPKYKENYIRFIQVIRAITIRETPVEQHARMERLRKRLKIPREAARAALELEAIGTDAIPILKEGLKSPSAEVRFYSADALAYLGDRAGMVELAAAAEREDAFRVFALAAMATIDEYETHELLQSLMNEYGSRPDELPVEPSAVKTTLAKADHDSADEKSAAKNPAADKDKDDDSSSEKSKLPAGLSGPERDAEGRIHHGAELRYGAFRTMWTMDRNHPFLQGEKIRDQFHLHVLQTTGEPMVHLTRNRVSEVVLFGAEQQFRTPIALSAGRYIVLNAPAGSELVTISKFVPGQADEQRTVSTRIADVIRAIGELEATYPDTAQMLVQAQRQGNIPGRLEMDALPQSGRIYHRPPEDAAIGGEDSELSSKATVGNANLVPNIFQSLSDLTTQKKQAPVDFESDLDSAVRKTPKSDDDKGEASFSDVSTEDDEEEESEEKEKKPGVFKRVFQNPFKSKAPSQTEPDVESNLLGSK